MKNFIFKIKESFRKVLSRIGSDPKKDWNVFILFASTFLVAMALYHISIFFSASEKTPDILGIDSSTVKTLDREGLSSILKYFDSKDIEYKIFISKPQSFRDPSF